MNGFIERMDERRRQRSLRDEASAAAGANQQPLDAVGQRGATHLRSDDSGLSNSSDSTSASLRERARKLQEEALLRRDQATCVRGAQQTFRLRVAEMREQEAAKLLAMADAADEEASHQGPLSPIGSDANVLHSARGPLLSEADTPRGAQDTDVQAEARIAELLAAAAERRDKATCVKGGKQRALLAVAERMESEAHALAAAIRQQQQEQQEQQQSQQQHHPMQHPMQKQYHPMQKQHHSGAGDEFGRRDSASLGRLSGSSEASYNSQHLRQQQQQQSMYGDQGPLHLRSVRDSEAQYGMEAPTHRSMMLPQQRQQQHMLLPETPREEAERRQQEHAVLVGKRRASGACELSPADQALAEEAEKLRQEALLCRDKASCCSGAKQRQLISLAELKERRAADMISQMAEPAVHSHRSDSSTKQPFKQQHYLQQQPERRAAGELRGRIDPRGDSGIFDQ